MSYLEALHAAGAMWLMGVGGWLVVAGLQQSKEDAGDWLAFALWELAALALFAAGMWILSGVFAAPQS